MQEEGRVELRQVEVHRVVGLAVSAVLQGAPRAGASVVLAEEVVGQAM